MNRRLTFLSTACLLLGGSSSLADEGIDFFETAVRPLLVKHCYACHSANSDPVEGGLRLDSRAAWQRGGDSGPAIAPGKPAQSRLLKAVLYQDPTLAMPPDGALSKREIEVLRKWIELGAPDPRTDKPVAARSINLSEGRRFWSFQPIADPPPPQVADEAWPRNAVDRFVLAQLEARGMRPVDRADRRTLIRRASLDVRGLPPTPDEVREFVDDQSPDAWPRLVDRLLASPHFGERWGRHWLDVARYADDQLREEFFYRPLPHAWRYRDWVVNALNVDLPYDQFIVQQLAGDILVDSFGPQATAATGFLALGMIYQDDGGTPEGVAVAKAETLDDRVDTVTRGLLGLTVSCGRCHDHKFDPIPTEDYYSLAGVFQNSKYVEEAPLVEQEVVAAYKQAQAEIAAATLALSEARKAKEAAKIDKLNRLLAELKREAPRMYPRAHAIAEQGDEDMRVALRGNRLKPGPLAPRRFLRVIAGDSPPRFTQGSGRLELAQAIASPQNPLTARVVVNRIWQHYFGRAIVATASNFGALGERPTHPRLLDWLAARLLEADWSLKRIHREILLSSTYQLSADRNIDNHRVDGGNRWLWRTPPRRLDIEAFRDSLLSVSGELDLRLSGPAEADALVSRRRTIYVAVRRDNQTASDEVLRTFDFPNPRLGSSGRRSTTTPQQQLFALNSPFIIQRARSLAARTKDVRQLFLLVLARDASPKEVDLANQFLKGSEEQPTEFTRWEQYCQILLISNEAMHRP